MDKLIERILKFFENKSISFGLRTSIFIISLFVLITSDYFFDFSYDYHLDNKIERLESINNLKNIYESDTLKIRELTELENRIYNRTHYSYRVRNIDLSHINIFKQSEIKEINSPVNENKKTTLKKPIRSLFWMVLTSNYFFILLVIVLIILPFTGSVHRELKNVLGSIAAIIILIGIISLITWLAYKIPLIWNRPYLNYILNIILHSPFLYILYVSTKKN
ncbi:MAG: hypothetical protein R3218_02110 [Christiangramia sp.]|nr:hypothetical protein [Christiangramia sp.]